MSMRAADMAREAGAGVPLAAVSAEVLLQDLLAEVRMAQTWRNDSDQAIEGVFTFPVPRDATLLDLEVELGERRLRGQVVALGEARERYEDAVTDGDSAVLLERPEPGLYSVSLGNLQPGERVVIGYRYAQLLQAQGHGLRFALPTALAPRYGDPEAAGLEPAQVPEADLLIEYPFSFRMQVHGRLARARVHSPSHRIAVGADGSALELSGAGRAVLNRDLVVQFELDESLPPSAVVAEDGDHWVALASLPLPPAVEAADEAWRCAASSTACARRTASTSSASAPGSPPCSRGPGPPPARPCSAPRPCSDGSTPTSAGPRSARRWRRPSRPAPTTSRSRISC